MSRHTALTVRMLPAVCGSVLSEDEDDDDTSHHKHDDEKPVVTEALHSPGDFC